ncbi:MAG: hypothetical protein H0W61_12110 [Bacteroidetes bacterium]|nr:hypothetical protein [Bacteroidota bacterium]
MMSKVANSLPGKFLFVFLLSFIINNVTSQIVVDEAPRGLYYMRTARVKKFKDMKDFRDVFHNDKFLLGRNRISGSINYNVQRVLINDGLRTKSEFRNALGFFTRIRFFEEFSFNSTFYVDFNKRAAARWIADYSYSIGRYNWRPYRFNYGYENYINNKYTDNIDQFMEKFSEGYYFLSFNANVPDRIVKKIRLDSTTSIKFVPFVRYAFRYRDENEVVHYEGKPTAGISCRLTLFWNIYVEGAAYYYFDPMYRQLPWDPDYSYGFGYFDWRSFRASITYGNWAINRFPGKKNLYPEYGFFDGNFKVTLNWIW